MTFENIGYHTRLYSNNGVKVTGGSFGGQIDMETVERLSRLFTVAVLPSGLPVFIDREGRRVTLYLSVDPGSTQAGKAALADWRKERERTNAQERKRQEAYDEELDALIDELGIEHAIELLKEASRNDQT